MRIETQPYGLLSSSTLLRVVRSLRRAGLACEPLGRPEVSMDALSRLASLAAAGAVLAAFLAVSRNPDPEAVLRG